MTEIDEPNSQDPFDLGRFTKAQGGVYETALSELKAGNKRTRWMWFIFPQFDGLGSSATSKYYAIKSIEEAKAYLTHPVLGPSLEECAEAVLAVEGRSAFDIFGPPDDIKLKSSMTLFEFVAGEDSVFRRVLEKYFYGERDATTLQLIGVD